MFELIKAVIEPVTKALSIPDLLARRDRKKLREIGTELFVFYSSANEILVLGYRIVGEIERACSWMRRKLEQGKPDESFGSDLPFWLGLQRASLLKLVQTIKRLGLELQIIDRVSYAALVPLIHGKGAAISRLADLYSEKDNDVLPIYDEHLLQNAMDKATALAAAQPVLEESRSPSQMIYIFDHPEIKQITLDAQRTMIRGLSSIPAKRLDEFLAYLEEERPRERLATIESALDGLRIALEKNFSIADVLLEVRDERACPTNRWAGF
jgi:hypothetical protein